MSRISFRSKRLELGISLAIIGLLLVGGSYGPVTQPVPQPEEVAAGSLQSYWRATMLEIRAGWHGAFGKARNSGYQLYAATGTHMEQADPDSRFGSYDSGQGFSLR